MDGLGAATTEATPIGSKRGPKTEAERIEEARERVALAVAEMETAVKVAKRFDVPGWDLGAYLVTKMGPTLAEIGFTTKALPKGRKEKT